MVGVAERFVIPDDLARAADKEERGDWLAELPALVARIAADWQIEVGDPLLPGGATAWVAPARDHAGNDAAARPPLPAPGRYVRLLGHPVRGADHCRAKLP